MNSVGYVLNLGLYIHLIIQHSTDAINTMQCLKRKKNLLKLEAKANQGMKMKDSYFIQFVFKLMIWQKIYLSQSIKKFHLEYIKYKEELNIYKRIIILTI